MSLDDAQKEMAHLSQLLADEREKNTSLSRERDHYRAAVDSVSADARARCAERDAALAENTRLHLAESHDGCDLLACEVKRELTGLAHGVATLKQENTPLVARVAALEKQLSEERFDLNSRCGALAEVLRRIRADGYLAGGILERIDAVLSISYEPAVTGTTSDSATFRKPLPFVPDQGPCACGDVRNDWAAVHTHETLDGIKHRKDGCA
jgi:hypothetical protein